VRGKDPKGVFTLAVSSEAGWRLAGVVGLPGSAVEWGERMNGAVPPRLVPEGPLSPDGSITARFLPATGGQQ
jgi:hypothetical protein